MTSGVGGLFGPELGGVLGDAEQAASGAEGGASAFGKFFGSGNIGEQLLVWNVLGSVIGALISPAVNEITQSANVDFPLTPLSPQEAATAVVRGFIDAGAGTNEAARSGLDSARFAQLTQLGMSPPQLGILLAAYQRYNLGGSSGGVGAIDLDTALQDLGINPAYNDLIKAMSVQIPTVQEVMNAWLEGQIEPAEANQRYLAAGGDPSWFQTSYNSQGQAPTPVEALEMLNRGLIVEGGTGPESTSYNQAFLEGPWRNKWLAAFLGLRYYVPPPRTVTALLKEGAITEAEATQYLQASGLDPALTAIYIAAASHSTTAAQRELTQAQIIGAYEDGLLTHDQAHTDLVAARYSASDATLLLALADKKAATASIKSAVTRLQTLYLDGKNDATVTTAALHTLGLADEQAATLLATWDLERSTVTKTLTAAEITGAAYYGIFTQPTAEQKLMALGYSLEDADVLLAVRSHGLLTGMVAV